MLKPFSIELKEIFYFPSFFPKMRVYILLFFFFDFSIENKGKKMEKYKINSIFLHYLHMFPNSIQKVHLKIYYPNFKI